MPLHDWTHVPAGLFHHFHQCWTVEIARALNNGLLPPEMTALIEQRSAPIAAGFLPRASIPVLRPDPGHATAVVSTNAALYAAKANRIVIRHHLGRIIAVIEIVSPGNKDSRSALQRFVEKTIDFLDKGIHVLVVDVFPPTARDPNGIHQLIWENYNETDAFTFPPGRDRLLASYERAVDLRAYLKPVALGQPLPDTPLFLTADLTPNLFVNVPLESAYQATWNATPQLLRSAVETGVLPGPAAPV